jgi:hypothetical protein
MSKDDWACYCCEMCQDTERERIIKLLKTQLLTNPQPNMENDMLGSFSHAMHNQMIHNMVALIKGENK